jgi:hypothetical protein
MYLARRDAIAKGIDGRKDVERKQEADDLAVREQEAEAIRKEEAAKWRPCVRRRHA